MFRKHTYTSRAMRVTSERAEGDRGRQSKNDIRAEGARQKRKFRKRLYQFSTVDLSQMRLGAEDFADVLNG